MDREDDPRAILEGFFERTIDEAEHVWLITRELQRVAEALLARHRQGEYEDFQEDVDSMGSLVDGLATRLVDLRICLREAGREVIFIEEICRNIQSVPVREQREAANRVANFASGSRRGPRETERAMYNLQQRQARAVRGYLTENFSIGDFKKASDKLKTLEFAVEEVDGCVNEARKDLEEGAGQKAIKRDLKMLCLAARAAIPGALKVYEAVEHALRNY